MPTTFKALVYADNRRQDGTYNLKIRVTHNRATLKVSTNLYAAAEDLTRSLKLKNQQYIDQTDDLIRRWRGVVAQLGVAAEAMSVKQIVEHIRQAESHGDEFRLDFIAYGRKVAAAKAARNPRTGANYDIALNAFGRFLENRLLESRDGGEQRASEAPGRHAKTGAGRPTPAAETLTGVSGEPSLDIAQITPKLLSDFERFIEQEPVMRGDARQGAAYTGKSKAGGRALSLYLGCLRHIHHCAKAEYNDEGLGLIRIPQSPFKTYQVRKQPKPRKRATAPSVVQSLIDLPNSEYRGGPKTHGSRRDLARDCALLSFGLVGMNAIDLYACPAQGWQKGGEGERIITYHRSKTRLRRDDEAQMQMRVEPCLWPLVERYLDPTGERLFCFHKRYASPEVFNSALKTGLRAVEEAIRPERHITFYTFRHTWATIARSDALRIDKYTVHEGLNHVDAEMKTTDRYIDRDYRPIWAANARVLGLFAWEGAACMSYPNIASSCL